MTRAAIHLYPFRYKKSAFKELPRREFLKALGAEGVPCSGGYSELNKMPYLKNAFSSKYFQKFYPKERLDYNKNAQENSSPLNEKMCNEQAVWIPQNILLCSKKDMENIALSIEKVQKNAEDIKKKF